MYGGLGALSRYKTYLTLFFPLSLDLSISTVSPAGSEGGVYSPGNDLLRVWLMEGVNG